MLELSVKTVLSSHSKYEQKMIFFKTDFCLMQVKSIAECSKMEHSAILQTFIKLPFVYKTFVLSIFEWPLKIGFTVIAYAQKPSLNTHAYASSRARGLNNGPCLPLVLFNYWIFIIDHRK